MQDQPLDTAAIDLRTQLEQERHERRLDWMAVVILGILTLVSIWMLWQMMPMMSSASGPSPQVAEAGAWAKTFLTMLGGVAVGVLAGDRLRRGRQAQTPISGREHATAEITPNHSMPSTRSGRG